jgi:signal transduction histidine kinase
MTWRLHRLRTVSTVDVVVAISLAIAAQVEIWYPALAPGTSAVTGSKPILCASALLITLPLAVRRVAPLVSATLVMAATAAQVRLTESPDGLTGLVAVVLAAYSIAMYGGRRTYVGGLVVILGIAGMSTDVGNGAFAAIALGAAWIAGQSLQRRTARVGHLERERGVAVLAATEAERARIARELHDIVAHRVSTIVVQAQAADAQLVSDPEAARAGLQAIDETARQALGELRALLGILRREGEVSGRAPQPEVSQLPAMVEQARATGQPIEFVVAGTPRPLPSAIGVALYRIAQEALTNVLKHAPGAPATVTLRYCADAVEVDVSDAGPGAGVGNAGFGLVGMRERVGVLGGTLSSGDRPGGGFAVRARLPTADWDAS